MSKINLKVSYKELCQLKHGLERSIDVGNKILDMQLPMDMAANINKDIAEDKKLLEKITVIQEEMKIKIGDNR